ncbi:hypothetical protein GQ54DRAFT_132620 [Martensiomyces pterosporus]|nr:hypothetical protein GQ54DRAFT_132620 [Martensiomyces pterosporus]
MSVSRIPRPTQAARLLAYILCTVKARELCSIAIHCAAILSKRLSHSGHISHSKSEQPFIRHADFIDQRPA